MSTRGLLLSITLVIGAFAMTVALYGRLPDPVPTHFDLHGVADGFTRKPFGAFILPALMLALIALFAGVSAWRPRALGTSARTLDIVVVATLALLFEANAITLAVTTGAHIAVTRLLFLTAGLYQIVLGNYLGKLRRNYFIGVRTPWTLRDDDVWARTHRVAGPCFMLGGAALLLGALGGGSPKVLVLVLCASVLLPWVYSYVLSQRQAT